MYVKLFYSNLCPCWGVHVSILTGKEVIKDFKYIKFYIKFLIPLWLDSLCQFTQMPLYFFFFLREN